MTEGLTSVRLSDYKPALWLTVLYSRVASLGPTLRRSRAESRLVSRVGLLGEVEGRVASHRDKEEKEESRGPTWGVGGGSGKRRERVGRRSRLEEIERESPAPSFSSTQGEILDCAGQTRMIECEGRGGGIPAHVLPRLDQPPAGKDGNDTVWMLIKTCDSL